MARPKKPVSPEVEAARAANAATKELVAQHPLTLSRANHARAEKALSAFVAHCRNMRRIEWEAAGGCTRCGGTGRVNERRQGSDWFEWYPCDAKDCTSNTIGVPAGHNLGHETSGFNMKNAVEVKPTVDRGFCNVTQTITIAPLLSTPDEIKAYDDLTEDFENAAREAYMFERMYAVAIGVDVIVIGGRKLPQGTRGKVAWIGQNDPQFGGGSRLGVKIEGNEKLGYCDPERVLVLTPAIDWEAPRFLYGSFKQCQWAHKIRQEAIRNGHVFDWNTTNELDRVHYQTASWWIEMREVFAKISHKTSPILDEHADAMIAMIERG